MRQRTALTLVEVIIAIILVGVVMTGAVSSSSFFIKKITRDSRRQDMLTQISYCFEDIRLRCASAISIDEDYFFSAKGEVKNDFQFTGEDDPYQVTPDTTADDRGYRYCVEDGDFVRVDTGMLSREVMINRAYQPQVEFEYTEGAEPNFLTVTITLQDRKYPDITVSGTEGIRFWFIDVVK